MATSSVAAFVGVSLLLVLVPGADWAYAISSGLRGGSPIPAVGGLLIGYVGHTVAVMAGVAALLNCAVVYIGVALLARTLRTRPGVARGVSCASGFAMIAIGIALFAERLHS